MKVKAIVTVSVKIALPDNWGKESKLDQVFSQASAEAKNIISQHLSTIPNLTVNKDVEITAIITEN